MSYAIVLVFEGVNEDHYWAVNDKLGIAADGTGNWPQGLLAHAGGPTNDGWMVLERWVSSQAQQEFMSTRLGAALQAVGVPAPTHVFDTNTVNDQIVATVD